MLITISCVVIGHIRNNVSELIGAKTTKGKECCSNVSSRLWGGALRDETKNGFEGGPRETIQFEENLDTFQMINK